MTLLLAGVHETTIWMIADAAISGGNLGLRDREQAIKIVPSQDGKALVGFAGDLHYGLRGIMAAARLPAGQGAVDELLALHNAAPSADFAYGTLDETGPRLARISGGKVEWLSTFHIGDDDAFAHLQKIRHDSSIDAAPEALKTFICASRSERDIPKVLSSTTHQFLRLFAERQERSVGGWALPYMLNSEGAFLCGYGFSVSDPVFSQLAPGSAAPPSTAEAGGFSLSITELGMGEGIIAYWSQLPGGRVYCRRDDAFEVLEFNGPPSVFKQSAAAALGKPIDIWFSEAPLGRPDHVTVMRDQFGKPSAAIVRSGRNLSVSVLNVETPFHTGGAIKLDVEGSVKALPLDTESVSVQLSDDSSSAIISLRADTIAATAKVTASQLDDVIACLGRARALMSEARASVPPNGPGTIEEVVVDPGWTIEGPLHPSLGGVTFRIRHPGLGWLTFLLPYHEAASLGGWFSKLSDGK